MPTTLPYNPMPITQVIERLRDLRTAQVELKKRLPSQSPGMPMIARNAMLITMASHINALGNAIEMVYTLQQVQAALNTQEAGEGLVAVARNAHTAEQELATCINQLTELQNPKQ